MGMPYLRRNPMLLERAGYTINQVLAVSVVIHMLELAAAALREVTARRLLMVRARHHAAILQQQVARCC